MNSDNEAQSDVDSEAPCRGWGPWLFSTALLASLGFFWWLLIYRHGVMPQH